MYFKLFFVSATCAVCVLMACKKDSTTAPSTPEFVYTAYDFRDQQILAGTITLAVSDSANMSGAWSINQSTSDSLSSLRCGPQVGTGTWRGTRSGLTFVADLSPGVADNNVVLNGVATFAAAGDQIPVSVRGTWQWTTLHGIANHGPFLLTRQ